MTIVTTGPASKFATMDLVGAPHQAIIGPKSIAEGKVELKTRRGGERELISVDAAIARLWRAGVTRNVTLIWRHTPSRAAL